MPAKERIACLGWGSLIWDPRKLPIRREWFKDGPFAPVEFIRQSADKRITLVIDPHSEAAPIRLLWAQMDPMDLQKAKEALRDREGLPQKDWEKKIGKWKKGEGPPEHILDLPAWASAHGLDAVIWTALPPKFDGRDERPSSDQVINHLLKLTGEERDNAKRYIECAPRQIDTDYRRRIESDLGWRSCREY